MPYLTEDRKEYLKGAWTEGVKGGDINYLFTLLLIKKWQAKPCYQTIHDLKLTIMQMAADDEFWDLRATLLEHGVALIEINAAAELAYLEFYRRVASEYEDFKASSNGDVYQEAIDNLYDGITGSERRGA